jgi:hypothetical protein
MTVHRHKQGGGSGCQVSRPLCLQITGTSDDEEFPDRYRHRRLDNDDANAGRRTRRNGFDDLRRDVLTAML